MVWLLPLHHKPSAGLQYCSLVCKQGNGFEQQSKSCVKDNGGLFGTQSKLGLKKNLGIIWT